MNALLTDLLAVFGVVLNALPQGLLALSFGFAAVPTAMASVWKCDYGECGADFISG